MDFAEFERLVLRVLFETNVPLTAAHIAYLGGISVRTAERHLARMAEEGSLLPRARMAGEGSLLLPATPDAQIEYSSPGPRALPGGLAGAAGPTIAAEAF